MADHAVKLEKYEIANANHYFLRGFRIRIEVIDYLPGTDPNIFVFRRNPPNPVNGDIFDEFMTVASFPDMAEYPVGDPDPEKKLPFFRGRLIELDVRSMVDYEFVWTTIKSQSAALMHALTLADNLVASSTSWEGSGFTQSASSQSSSDQSMSGVSAICGEASLLLPFAGARFVHASCLVGG